MAQAFLRLTGVRGKATSETGEKTDKNHHPHQHGLCLATKHVKELHTFLRAVEGNEDSFKEWVGKIRDEWQAKLDSEKPEEGEVLEGTEHTNESDFCLPLNELHTSKACPLFRHTCGTFKPDRCMVSL
eukprot:Skav214097  [mRNA]  locus=scaffold1185:149870:154294:- [translate_table: standard]